MPYYHIKDFVRGLDTRRMVETTEPGSLIVAKNCVITRGGEIEKRKAWNPIKSLPDNTFGLYALGGTGGDFHVWGTLENPGVMPGGVTYHRLQHPDGEEIKFIRCVRYFRKKFFVIAQFENDDILAYYDGVPIIEDPRPPEDADPASPPVAVEQNPVGGNRATIMLSPVRNQQNTACSIIKVSAWRLTGDALAGSDSWEAHDIYSGSIAILPTPMRSSSTSSSRTRSTPTFRRDPTSTRRPARTASCSSALPTMASSTTAGALPSRRTRSPLRYGRSAAPAARRLSAVVRTQPTASTQPPTRRTPIQRQILIQMRRRRWMHIPAGTVRAAARQQNVRRHRPPGASACQRAERAGPVGH
jgi:hypothetical protein